jgi:hypothetical protein
LGFVHNGDTTEGNDGEIDSGFAETALGDGREVRGGDGTVARPGEGRSGGGGFQEITTKHGASSVGKLSVGRYKDERKPGKVNGKV